MNEQEEAPLYYFLSTTSLGCQPVLHSSNNGPTKPLKNYLTPVALIEEKRGDGSPQSLHNATKVIPKLLLRQDKRFTAMLTLQGLFLK